MNNENEIINDYLNPLLSQIMDESLQNVLNMKEEGLLTEEKDIKFILEFLEDADQYYSNINSHENQRKIFDLKHELQNLI
jgi:hypothetical protein